MTTPAAGAQAPSPIARRILVWLPALLWMLVIFRFSAVPGSNVPGRWGNLAHFVEYAILACLLFVPLRRRPAARAAALVVVLASLYAISDEFHQAFVPGRVPDPADWAIDTLGAALAATFLALRSRTAKTARRGRSS